MGSSKYLGLGSRLKKGPATTLAESAFSFELKGAPYLLRGLSYADMAHVAMLLHCKIIPEKKGIGVLKKLKELHSSGFEQFEFDPMVGDIYNNRDIFLEQKLGNDSGIIHTGRARREAVTIAWQIACRKLLLEVGRDLTGFCDAMLSVAKRHQKTYMPDFTYLQHAHPTTLAHYFLGFLYPLLRDVGRVERALNLMNRSPAGSGSVNGSRLPMDREYLADLLGFEGVIEHTRDAMWAPDRSTECMAALVTLGTNMNRLAEELQIWATQEFGFAQLDDSHSRTSVIMPQKKNPYALAFIRGQARSLVGQLVELVSTNLTVSGQPDNRMFAYSGLPESLEWTNRAIRLMTDVISKCSFDKSRMLQSAQKDYSYATDVCDYLLGVTGLPNRTLHKVVGLAVRNCMNKGD
ncbi:MAG: lyase family protein, partial [Pseudomonadota bacterium]